MAVIARHPPFAPWAASREIDGFTKDGAALLAATIAAKWASVGHPDVRVWIDDQAIERAAVGGVTRMPVVRSNLVNGLPPRRATPRAVRG